MAKKVTIEVDAERSSLRIVSGKMFLGTRTAVELDGWEPDSANHRPVLTVFAQGSTVPLAQSSYDDGALTLDLTGAELRKAFHGEAARHQFGIYLNQQVTEDDGDTWTWKPESVSRTSFTHLSMVDLPIVIAAWRPTRPTSWTALTSSSVRSCS